MNAHPRDIHGTPTLPDAIDAEKILLGAILVRNECINKVPATFDPNCFEVTVHRRIFEAILKLHEEGRTFGMITVKNMVPDTKIREVDDLGNPVDMTVSQYMARLVRDAVTFVGVEDWCKAITACSARRDLHMVADDLRQIAFEDELRIPDDVAALRQRLAEITQSLAGEEASFSLSDAIDRSFDAVNDASRGKKTEGLDPGISEVMQLTGPWQKGQLIIIGGGVKQGKTALAMQCMFEIAKTSPVFLYSGEMTVKQIIMREQARRTGISARQQQRGRVSDQEVQSLLEAGIEIKRSKHVEIDCRKMTLDQIGRKARALKKSHGIGAVFVDHIGKIQWEGKMQYEDEFKQGQIATSKLKDLAMELDLPVVALTHLKKSAFQEYQGNSLEKRLHAVLHRRPTYRDLIGNMDKDADQVIIPFQPRPILAGMEPGEGTPEWNVWKTLMDETEGKAEILLSLSRESEFPRRRDIAWDGNSTSYGMAYKAQQNARELF